MRAQEEADKKNERDKEAKRKEEEQKRQNENKAPDNKLPSPSKQYTMKPIDKPKEDDSESWSTTIEKFFVNLFGL